MRVHAELGENFLESVYQDALEVMFRREGIPYVRECRRPIEFLGEVLPTVYRADFVCYGSIIVELKASAGLGDHDFAQVIHYLRASGLTLAVLANFGRQSLQWRRIIMNRERQPSGRVERLPDLEQSV